MSFQNFVVDAVKDHFSSKDSDINSSASHASTHASENADSSLFSQALNFVQERRSAGQYNESDEVDEAHAVDSHRRYEEGGDNMNSQDLGAGAAMRALQSFNSGSGEETGGGRDQNAFIGMAMAQAEKMWEEKNGRGEAVSFPYLPLIIV